MFPQHLNIRLHLIKQLKLSSNLFFQKNIIFSSLLWLQWLPPKSTTRGNAVRNRCSTYTSTLHNALRNSIFFFFFFPGHRQLCGKPTSNNKGGTADYGLMGFNNCKVIAGRVLFSVINIKTKR